VAVVMVECTGFGRIEERQTIATSATTTASSSSRSISRVVGVIGTIGVGRFRVDSSGKLLCELHIKK